MQPTDEGDLGGKGAEDAPEEKVAQEELEGLEDDFADVDLGEGFDDAAEGKEARAGSVNGAEAHEDHPRERSDTDEPPSELPTPTIPKPSPTPSPSLSRSPSPAPPTTSSHLSTPPASTRPSSTSPTPFYSIPLSSSTSPPPSSPASPASPATPRSPIAAMAGGTAPKDPPPRRGNPSPLEKYVNKTRPSYLPPKAREEEKKALKTWTEMMKASREAEKQKAARRQSQLLKHEAELSSLTQTWQTAILPQLRNALRDPSNRTLFWRGIPPALRGRVWAHCVGNDLALGRDSFELALKRSSRPGGVGADDRQDIERDTRRAFPRLKLFAPGEGAMHDDLVSVLLAWTVDRRDAGLGYFDGTANIAAMLLLNMPPAQAYVVLSNLLQRQLLRAFWEDRKEEKDGYYRILRTLMAEVMPKAHANFTSQSLRPSSFLPPWLHTLFTAHLPLEAASLAWDLLLLLSYPSHSDASTFQIALTLLCCLEARLHFPERAELVRVLGLGEDEVGYERWGVGTEDVRRECEALQSVVEEGRWDRLVRRELPE